VEEPSGYVGGYLVTNAWGRPLEFRVSNPVQPNRVQLILYGGTLRPYICADLIGKTLVDKTATGAQIIVTDCRPVLDLRQLIETPIVWLAISGESGAGSVVPGGMEGPVMSLPAGKLYCHPEFPADKQAACKLLERLPDCFDLAEPFVRIREAISEARKMGVTNRAA
jgi:hypothetical protein